MLSVVVLSFNTREITLRCLKALYRSTNVDFEVIIVDNASTDGSSEAIEKQFPKAKVIVNTKNVGFAAGNNQAMQEAKGEFILLLNSDAFVFEDTLEKMLRVMKSREGIDMLGCKLMYRDGRLQPSWGYFPTLRRVLQMMLFVDNLPIIRDRIDSIHVRSEKRYQIERRVDWVTGAVVMLKKAVFEKTQGVDEKYFMYGEEMEWMLRAEKSGYSIWYTPKAECVHLEGSSSKDRSIAIIGEMKGWLYWYGKHSEPFYLKILAVEMMFGCLLRMVLKPKTRFAYKSAFNEIWSGVFGQTN